jgi:AcrR family transcriptional regulator
VLPPARGDGLAAPPSVPASAGNMATDLPLTRERILAAAEDVVRRFGPGKATVVDVARALGVSHAAVYRHFSSKAELREAVVGQWIDRIMPPLRAVARDGRRSPERRLRRFFDDLVAAKRRRATDDPELFAAFRTLAGQTQAVVRAHVDELAALVAAIVAAGVADGSFAPVEPASAARAILSAVTRFHHPAHAAEWADPDVDAAFDDVWRLLVAGLRAGTR